MKTAYQVLEVVPGATDLEVKESYRRLSRLTHPDKGGSKEDFSRIADAWASVGDRKLRAKYDSKLRVLMNICGKCDGKGLVVEMKGWKSREFSVCKICEGVGFFQPIGRKTNEEV